MTERIIINFHGLGPKPGRVESGEARVWCEDVDLYRAILDELCEAADRQQLDYLVTFDDGNVSDATIGAPELVKRGMSATFFPCAGRIGTPGYLDAAMLRELSLAGMCIGSHGWAHIDWRRADASSMRREIDEAKDRVEQTIGSSITAAAIPFGSYDRRVLRYTGPFKTVYTSDAGLARKGSRIQPRISYTRDWRRGSVMRSLIEERHPGRRLRRSLAMLYKRLR